MAAVPYPNRRDHRGSKRDRRGRRQHEALLRAPNKMSLLHNERATRAPLVSSRLRRRPFECGMLPPRTQGYSSLLVQRRVTRRKHAPDGANTSAHPRFRDPALPLREIHLALGRRRHPVCAPLGGLARNLAVRGRAIRGPKKPHISGLRFRCLRCSARPKGHDSS